jgi:hypothetical protein
MLMHVPRNNLAGGGKWRDPYGLIKRHTSATNREIAELTGNLSFPAVAKIDRSISSPLVEDDDLRGFIQRIQSKYSYFKT